MVLPETVPLKLKNTFVMVDDSFGNFERRVSNVHKDAQIVVYGVIDEGFDVLRGNDHFGGKRPRDDVLLLHQQHGVPFHRVREWFGGVFFIDDKGRFRANVSVPQNSWRFSRRVLNDLLNGFAYSGHIPPCSYLFLMASKIRLL